MRLLHITHSLGAGGMENGIVNIANALPSDYEIHACCLARGGEFVPRFPNPGNVHILGKKDGFSWSTVTALRRCIRSLRPDIIHTHNLGPLIYTALAAPAAPILHGEHAELTPAELAPHRRLIRRFLYTRVARIHTVSHSLRESLVRHGFPASRIEILVNGVDTSRFHPAPKADARRETGIPVDALILGLVGRFGPFKRHADLIAAFERLAPGHPSLALLFLGGGGPMESAIRARAGESPFTSRIHFSGFQPDPRPWLRAIDLLVIPSTNEGLSNALLEAMSCGVPALAHTACGNADVIQDPANGFLRDISTPESLYSALKSILKTPERLPPVGRAARERIESAFSFPQMLSAYDRLYRTLLTSQ